MQLSWLPPPPIMNEIYVPRYILLIIWFVHRKYISRRCHLISKCHLKYVIYLSSYKSTVFSGKVNQEVIDHQKSEKIDAASLYRHRII